METSSPPATLKLINLQAKNSSQVAIIIPALNEAASLESTLASLRAHRGEIIVADGGSTDGTVEIALQRGYRVVSAPGGRGSQQNAGAKATQSGLLLFLHADTQLPEDFEREVRRILAMPGVFAGAFRLEISSSMRAVQWIQKAANWRSRFLQLPYGDQGLFMTRKVFEEVGGFRQLPIMEDFDLVWRLRQRGRIRLAKTNVITSARRWETVGPWKTTWINQVVIAGYLLGVSPRALASLYRRNLRGSSSQSTEKSVNRQKDPVIETKGSPSPSSKSDTHKGVNSLPTSSSPL